jgi:hypothetical protein
MYERLGIAAAVVSGTAATTITGPTTDMRDGERVLYILAGQGSGTAVATIQAGSITYGTNTDGQLTTGGIPTWANLSGADGVASAVVTANATNGEIKTIEIRAESMPSGARYLRAQVASGTANTYASLVALLDVQKYNPVDQDNVTSDIYV